MGVGLWWPAQLSEEAGSATQRAHTVRLQGAWEAAEGEKGALQVEVARLQNALAQAQHEREAMEATLLRTDQELNEARGPPAIAWCTRGCSAAQCKSSLCLVCTVHGAPCSRPSPFQFVVWEQQ